MDRGSLGNFGALAGHNLEARVVHALRRAEAVDSEFPETVGIAHLRYGDKQREPEQKSELEMTQA